MSRCRIPIVSALAALSLLATATAQSFELGREGALELRDGTRLAGVLEKTSSTKSLALRRGARLDRIAVEDALRFVPVESLEQQLAGLEARARKSAFTRVQLGLRAFEIGHWKRGMRAVAALDDDARHSSPRAAERLEQRAAREWLARLPERPPHVVARQLLQELRTSNEPVDAAERRVAWRVLHALMQSEAAADARGAQGPRRAKSTKTARAVCSKFASTRMHAHRQASARRALLALDEDAQRFVYRQALSHPQGETHRAIVTQLRATEHADSAARYLSRWLGKPRRGLEMRAVRTLGMLGSAEAVAPLEALAKSLPARRKAYTGGAGGHRAHVAFTTEQAYIADFEVEIATAAAIAKPVVRSARSGVVLDATVGAITVLPYFRDLGRETRRSLRMLRAPAAGARKSGT